MSAEEAKAKFAKLVRSIDGIFPQPAFIDETFFFQGRNHANSHIVYARKWLCTLFHMDLDQLIDSTKLSEVVDLSIKLQDDSSLNPEQRCMLKKISELAPPLGEEGVSVKELADQVDKLLAYLHSNLPKARLLFKGYNSDTFQWI